MVLKMIKQNKTLKNAQADIRITRVANLPQEALLISATDPLFTCHGRGMEKLNRCKNFKELTKLLTELALPRKNDTKHV